MGILHALTDTLNAVPKTIGDNCMNLVFKGFGSNVKQFFEIHKGKKVVEVEKDKKEN